MKSRSLFKSLVLSLSCVAVLARAQTPAPSTPVTPPVPATMPAAAPAKPTFTDAQLVEEFGWFVAKRIGLAELDLNKDHLPELLKGLTAGAEGKDSPFELPVIGPQMNEFMQRRQAAYMAKAKEKGAADAAAFFSKLKENKNVMTLPSGLSYEVVIPGSGPAPKPSDTVTVNYTGTLTNGQVFDASPKGEPAEFVLSEVIPGWTEGLQKISKGGKIKLYIPPELAYGSEAKPGIPASSTLVFEVDLLNIKTAPVAPMPPVGAPVSPAGPPIPPAAAPIPPAGAPVPPPPGK